MTKKNTNYGHLNDARLVYANNPVAIDGALVFNPTREQYLKIGEKYIDRSYPSEQPEEGKEWTQDGWTQTETEIKARWIQTEIPEEPEEEVEA